MLPELTLTMLVAAIPGLNFAFTHIAIRVGPNPFVGFRISTKMKDKQVWDTVHRALTPLLAKQLLLTFVAVPVIAGLYFAPPSFPFLLLSLIVVMLAAIAHAGRRAVREIKARA
ncbi:SdpI family protein [Microbacterium sp. X-17]|uniref:SdpI family protein n=1 Tax=Microbacterium sp. X-17 TaxID=3144404 RepID=UPI0031F4C3DD